jgi:trehalose utilization protein
VRILIWNENVHETNEEEVAARYPRGIHGAIADGISPLLTDASVETATLADALPSLDGVDVLVWWGHIAHDQVSDDIVEAVHGAVLAGMGLVVLHSGHFSKIFKRLMGTTCSLQWRDDGDRELIWSVAPGHPITEGVDMPLVIEEHETYGEFFDIPTPDELVFVSSFSGGEVFRSGATWRRGQGKVFYFSPGDQRYPIYHHAGVSKVIANGVAWAAPSSPRQLPGVTHLENVRRFSD